MNTLKIKDNYITLGQMLKLSGIIQTGGEVKSFLEQEIIYVNEEVEKRRGRKLYPGDIVHVLGDHIVIA